MASDRQIVDLAQSLRNAEDPEPLLERIGDARVVLLGEASHGTHEYYTWRAALTRRALTPLHEVHPSGAEMETYPHAD